MHRNRCGFECLRSVAHVRELDLIPHIGFNRELTIHIGNGTDGGSFDEYRGADERTIRILDRTRDSVLRECQACSSHEENYKAKQIPEIRFHDIEHL